MTTTTTERKLYVLTIAKRHVPLGDGALATWHRYATSEDKAVVRAQVAARREYGRHAYVLGCHEASCTNCGRVLDASGPAIVVDNSVFCLDCFNQKGGRS